MALRNVLEQVAVTWYDTASIRRGRIPARLRMFVEPWGPSRPMYLTNMVHSGRFPALFALHQVRLLYPNATKVNRTNFSRRASLRLGVGHTCYIDMPLDVLNAHTTETAAPLAVQPGEPVFVELSTGGFKFSKRGHSLTVVVLLQGAAYREVA